MSITHAMQAVAESEAELRAALNGTETRPTTATVETCRRVHTLTPDNIYIDAKGVRRCRECRAENNQRAYARKKAA